MRTRGLALLVLAGLLCAGGLWWAARAGQVDSLALRGPAAPEGAASLSAFGEGPAHFAPAHVAPATGARSDVAPARESLEPRLTVVALDGMERVVRGPGCSVTLRPSGVPGEQQRAALDDEGRATLAPPEGESILSLLGPTLEALPPTELVAPEEAPVHVLAWRPLAAGASGVRTVRFSTERWELRARLLDGDGAPLARALVDAVFGVEGAPACTLRTGPDGELHVALSVLPSHLGNPFANAVFAVSGGVPDEPLARATVPLRFLRAEERGVRDLGDVRLARRGTIVAGRVVDEDGAPVREGSVRVQRREPGAEYRNTGDAAAVREGAFHVRGAARAEDDLRLVVEAPGRFAAPTSFRCGSVDVLVIAYTGASLRATVRSPAEADRRQLDVTLESQGSGARWSLAWPELRAGGLEEGDYALVVSAHGREVARERIALAAGETREVELDVRTLLRRVRVTWRGEDGPLQRATACVLGPDAERRLHGDGEGGADVWCGGPFDVRVRAPGYERTEWRDVEADIEVVLTRGAWPVRIEAVGLPVLHGTSGWRASLHVSDGKDDGSPDLPLDDAGSATFELDAPGTWSVVLSLPLRGPWMATTRSVTLGEIRVRADERGLQTFRVPVPEDFLDRAGL